MTYLLIRKRKLLSISILLTCSFVIGFLFINRQSEKRDEKSTEQSVGQINNIDVHDTKNFFDEYLFQKGISEGDKQKKVKEKIRGAIVPHHLLASFIIADILGQIVEQDAQTIILLAPNHQDIGSVSVFTSELAWNTPYDVIMSDDELINLLIQKDYIAVDYKILDEEHAIGGLLPFIAYYSNTIRIVPLILRQNMTKYQLQDLSQSIADIVDDKTVVIASVDFSHYLNSIQAEEKDRDTLTAMKGKDYDTLLQMNSDYLDSPEAIVILLQVMERLGIDNSKILHHTNSGKLMNEYFAETTSYFGTIFTKL